jgi:ElaB/YqjD/DUF883 family membrane-anchored ribosome-binding protein
MSIDAWTPDGESIVEHVAGIEDYQVTLATYRAACKRWPLAPITLQQGGHASEGEPDPRICSIWPPSGHIFMVTRPSLVGMRPRGRRTEGSNMAFRKTSNGVGHDQPAGTEVEAEIREFVRRDVMTNRERQPENESEMVASSINSVLQRTTTTSVQEIDKLITELQTLSDTLHSERARVQREIVQYSTLTRAALDSTKIIAESLMQFKKAPDAPALPDLKDRSVAS